MTWGKVDDKLHMHPKVLDAGVDAMGLWVLALSHCCGYLTDGHVSEKIAVRLVGGEETARALAAKLVTAGLWHVSPDGGWEFHDWEEYQPTASQVADERERRSNAGRAAGKASAQRRAQRLVNDSSTTRQRSAPHVVGESSRGVSTPVPSRPVPDPEERERAADEPRTPSSVPQAKPESTEALPPTGRDPASTVRLRTAPPAAESVFPMPDDLPLTSEARSAADTLGVRDIDAEWAKFRAHQIKTGTSSTARGWYQGAWAKWIVDAAKYQRRDREREHSRGKVDPSAPLPKGPAEHPQGLKPFARTILPPAEAESARRLLAALEAQQTASTECGDETPEETARRAV